MTIKIITVGKTKEKYAQLAEVEFVKKIKRYTKLQQIFVKDTPIDSVRNATLVKDREAGKIAGKISDSEFVVALDKSGKQLSSPKFAQFLQDKMLHGTNNFSFVIGGPLGLATHFLHSADFVLSSSKMTFPHELSKVMLLEQIYRAFTIIHNEKYHK